MQMLTWPDSFVNKIICGDVLEVLRQMPDGCVDLIITDPPYGISQKKKKINRAHIENRAMRRLNKRVKELNYDFGGWDHFKDKKVLFLWTKSWQQECYRVLKPQGSFYSFFDKAYISFFEQQLRDIGFHVRSTMVWHKTNPVPLLFKVGYMSATEFFTFATKNKGAGHTFNYKLGQQHNMISGPICQGEERTSHPTQKPEYLFTTIMRYSSNEGDIVLDPFIGSGTTAKVALKLGRRFIGVDISERYCQMARERIKAELAQGRLF